jgi:hypothetical protein
MGMVLVKSMALRRRGPQGMPWEVSQRKRRFVTEEVKN